MRAFPHLVYVVALAFTIGTPAASAQTHNISTIAGTGTSGYSGDGGPATQAEISVPVGVTALDDGGYLIANQGSSVVRRVAADGTITTIAGGMTGFGGDNGPATSASLKAPSGVAMTADGGYLIADTNNNRIRRVAPDGTITTVVGNGSASFGGDNAAATDAQVAFPYDVAVQPDGGYLIADNDNNRIRRVAPDGTITTVAGGGAGGDGGPATSAQLTKPSGVALTPDGGYLIADTNANRVRKVAFDGTITTVAGTGVAGATGDGGPATAATLNHPARAVPEGDGGFVIADEMNARLRRVAPDGTITTVAGTTPGFSGDGKPATDAQLDNLIGAAVTTSGDYLIADTNNRRVRLVDAAATPAPVLTGSTPASPADDNAPLIVGTAPAGTNVALFANDTCTRPSTAGGTAAELAAPGIAVSVPDNTTTTFHATATDSTGDTSACSASSVTYVEKTAAAPLPRPVQGKTVNAVPEKGKVLVKVRGGKFVPLASLGSQLPVGSTIDTRKGTVRLTSAAGKGGKTQIGHFSGGLFTFLQTKKNPLTTLSMTGGGLSSCSKLPRGGSPKTAAAAKRKRRSLFSSVKGHFRTRGRNSAATVRGTSWRMTDTCKGTLTTVKTGSVLVRDFRLRKNRIVLAGHSYLASAPLRKKKKHG